MVNNSIISTKQKTASHLKSLNIEKISTYDLCNPGPSLGQAQNYLYIIICDTPHVVVLFIDCKHQQQIVWVLWFFIAVYVYVIWMWIDWYRKYQPVEPEYEVCWRVSFIFCRAGWYFSVSIIFTFIWHV